MLVNHNINNLTGGVSTQPQEMRFDNQVSSMVNFMPTVGQGLRRRNGMEHIGYSFDSAAVGKLHSYEGGDGNKYIVEISLWLSTVSIKVYQIDNFDNVTIKTITNIGSTNVIDAWKAIGGVNWSSDIQLLTVGDTTWILNKKQTVSMTDGLTPEYSQHKAFYWVKKTFDNGGGTVDDGYTYEVVINDVSYSYNHVNSLTVTSQLKADIQADIGINLPDYLKVRNEGSMLYIFTEQFYSDGFKVPPVGSPATNYVLISDDNGATELLLDITSGGGCEVCNKLIYDGYELYTNATDGYMSIGELVIAGATNITYYSANKANSNTKSVTFYETPADASFDFKSGDSWGNQASYGWKNSVSKIGDLPARMDGFSEADVGIIAVTGTDRDKYTNYYLKWNGDAWVETAKGGIPNTLDATTLPAKLIQKSDGTFQLGFIGSGFEYGDDEWELRLKGDDDSNPLPSFVGRQISNMFFFKNRLCFTSDENVIMSESGEYYNFFATTAMEVIDSDTIDVSVDSDTVSNIRHVTAVGNAVTLWSDNTQFLLSGGEVLSPATTRISKVSSYECDNVLTPMVADNEVLFFNRGDEYSVVKSYSPASLQNDSSSGEDVSAHISGYLPTNIYNPTISRSENMLFVRGSYSNEIYCYKYHIQGGKKVMSSWFKWSFNSSLKHFVAIGDSLYIFLGINYISKINLVPKDINETFMDYNKDLDEYIPYTSSVVLSKFNIQTQQGSRIIREPFMMKTIKVNRQGDVDLDIINSERASTKTVNSKHLDRKLFVGGNTDKVEVGFSTSYDNGCQIDAISIEGMIKTRSKNI